MNNQDENSMLIGLIVGGIIGIVFAIYSFSKDHYNNPKNKKQ